MWIHSLVCIYHIKTRRDARNDAPSDGVWYILLLSFFFFFPFCSIIFFSFVVEMPAAQRKDIIFFQNNFVIPCTYSSIFFLFEGSCADSNIMHTLYLTYKNNYVTETNFRSSDAWTFAGIQLVSQDKKQNKVSNGKRARGHWHLLYTLVNNPSLVGSRKHFQRQSSESFINGTLNRSSKEDSKKEGSTTEASKEAEGAASN